jgi:iron complex outermembrane receptor protein
VEVNHFPATDPIAASLGARPLKPEESTNYSIGLVFDAGPFELTVDAYRIDITDRIVLSESLLGSPTGNPTSRAIYNLLNPPGSSGTIGGGRFFVNGVDSETTGVDVVGRYRLNYRPSGRLDFTLAANFNETDVTRVPAIPSNVPIPNPPNLVDRFTVLTFEQGTPRDKYVFATELSDGPIGATFRATSYSDVLQTNPNNNPAFDIRTGERVLLDLEGRYEFMERLELAVGVNNLTDEYPEPQPAFVNTNGALGFPNYSPFGFNGRFLYARLTYGW